jgi:hypothetical protein
MLFLVSLHCVAEDRAEHRSIASPDKHFVVVFTGSNVVLPEAFTVQDIRGASVVSSDDLTHLRNIAAFRPEYASWSPDSQILALAGGGGHDCETFIFVRSGKTFTPVPVPRVTGNNDNPYITPLKWIKGRRLVLDISGPHAGKASGYSYKGRATIRILLTPPACEILYKRITEHNEPDAG